MPTPLFIDRARAERRGEPGGDAGPPTGGEAAAALPRPRAASAPCLRAPAFARAWPRLRQRRRRRPCPAAPQPRRPAAPRRARSSPGHRRGAVSWQQRVPPFLPPPLPRLVAAARLACAWLLEGEKEEGGTEDGEGKEEELAELYLCSHRRVGLGCSRAAFGRALSGCTTREKVSMQLSPGTFARYVPRKRRVPRRKQMLLPAAAATPAGSKRCNCHTVPELNLKREWRGDWSERFRQEARGVLWSAGKEDLY